jgi:DHA3 family tetracycline resistance protein-like MFS transporter
MHTKTMYNIIRSMMGLAFNLMFTAAALYRIDIAKLEIYQLILIGTALEIAVFLFETPTGVVADLKSRRLSVIIGLFIIGVGFIVEALTPYFIIIFLAQIIWGLGYTFISGALDAWVSDETHNIQIEKTILTGTQFNKGFAFLGILFAGMIGMYNIRLAMYIAGAIFILLGCFAVLFMKEHQFKKVDHETHILKAYFSQLKKGFQHIKNHHILRLMFIAMLFYGLYSEGIDRTFEVNILDGLGFRTISQLDPIWILVIVAATIELIGLMMIGIVKRYLSKGTHVIFWAMQFTSMMVMGILVFAFINEPYIALFGFLFFSFSREATYPLLDTILVKHTPSHVKATVLSTFGQLDAIGQLLSGVIMVGISAAFGLQNMYLITALLLVIPIVTFIKMMRLKHHAS